MASERKTSIGFNLPFGFEVPVRPAVARGLALDDARRGDGSTPADRRTQAFRRRALRRVLRGARRTACCPASMMPSSKIWPNGMRGSLRFEGSVSMASRSSGGHFCDTLLGGARIVAIAFDADEAPAEPLGDRTRRAGAEEGIEHDVARFASMQSGCDAAVLRASASDAPCGRRRPSAARAPSRSETASRSASADRRSRP